MTKKRPSYRATQKLTVNMGLRYEYFTPLSEINNVIGSFSPQVGFQQQGVNISHPYNPDHKDISPRLGIGWDLTGKGTTVVRAGFGLYYTEIIDLQLVGDTSLPGSNPGISSIPTAFTTYLANGTAQAPLNPTGGIGSAAVSIPGKSLNWNLGVPVLPASASGGFVCGNGLAPVNPVPGAPATNPAPCSILFTTPNLPSPRVTSWNVGIQHAFTPGLSVEANYIGNHGSRLTSITDINQINPNSPAEIACGHCESITDLPYYSQFAYLQYMDQMSDTAISNYEALQATLTARNFHNLSFIVGYTYSHALDDLPGGDFHVVNPQNSLNPMGDYGASQFDVRHHFSFTPTYNIPGKKSWGQMLEGWVLSSAIVFETGQPWSPTDSTDLSGTNELQDRWDFYGTPSDFNATFNPPAFYPGSVTLANGKQVINPGLPQQCVQQATAIGSFNPANPNDPTGRFFNTGCYLAGPGARSYMIAPAPGQFGTMARNLFYGPHFADWDFSIFKNFKLKERFTAQFRAEFFNILNHPIYANPGGPLGNTDPEAPSIFGCGCATPDVASTNPVLGTGAAREIQLGLKLLF